MIKVENVETWGFKGAIRGMRNPLNSWHLSDTVNWRLGDGDSVSEIVDIGERDMGLMRRLLKGGPVHAKYLRMIHLQMDLTAPLYFWKEWDTYKVATVRNSCSTMHKIHAKPFVEEDFSSEGLKGKALQTHKNVMAGLNLSRELYLKLKAQAEAETDKRKQAEFEGAAKEMWYEMIKNLPSSYNQKATVDLNYQTIIEMIRWRENHKLSEWRELVQIFKQLPHMEELLENE